MIGNKEEIMSCLSTKNRGVARGQWGQRHPPPRVIQSLQIRTSKGNCFIGFFVLFKKRFSPKYYLKLIRLRSLLPYLED